MTNKTHSGRLREDGVKKIHELRGEYDATGVRVNSKGEKTYQAIAEELRVSLGTVYNVCRGRTWPDLHPDPSVRASA